MNPEVSHIPAGIFRECLFFCYIPGMPLTCQPWSKWAVVCVIMMVPSVIKKERPKKKKKKTERLVFGDDQIMPNLGWRSYWVWSQKIASVLNVRCDKESVSPKIKFPKFHFLAYKIRIINSNKHFQISSHPPPSLYLRTSFPQHIWRSL